MPVFPRSERTENVQARPQPYSTGDGYEAPGRAAQQLGNGIASVGDAFGDLMAKAQKERDDLDMFQTKLALTNFAGEQKIYQSQYDSEVKDDGRDHVKGRLDTYDQAWQKLYEGLPNNEKSRQLAALEGARLRASYGERSYKRAEAHRQDYYVGQIGEAVTRNVLPQVSGDIEQAQKALAMVDGMIDSAPGLSSAAREKARQSAAQAVFKQWVAAAGPNAAEQAEKLAQSFIARRQNEMEDTARANVGEVAPVMPSEPGPDFRGQGGPAALRFNNPGAMYPGPSARKFGAVGTERIGGGHLIAVFPDAVSGAAANFDNMRRLYVGLPFDQFIAKWSGGNSSKAYAQAVAQKLGINGQTVVTEELLRNPEFAIPMLKGMSQWEAGNGKPYPMSDAQWAEAHARAFDGKVAAAPVRRRSTDYLVDQIIQARPQLEVKSAAALRKEQLANDREFRQLRRATEREGLDLLMKGELSRQWVEENEGYLGNRLFERFSRALDPKLPRVTNPTVLADLLSRANEDPDAIIREAGEYYANQQLNQAGYREVYELASRYLDQKERPPSWVAEQRSQIKRALMPVQGAPEDAHKAYVATLGKFDQFVKERGKEIDRKDLATFTEGVIKEHKTADAAALRKGLQMPKNTTVTREAMNLGEIERIRVKIQEQVRTGRMTLQEAGQQGALLQLWKQALEQEATSRGDKLDGAPKSPLSAPAQPQGQKQSGQPAQPGQQAQRNTNPRYGGSQPQQGAQ